LEHGRTELFQGAFHALAAEAAGDWFEEPAEDWREAAAESERFEFDENAVIALGERREGAGAPEIAAVLPDREQALARRVGIFHFANLMRGGQGVGEARPWRDVLHARSDVEHDRHPGDAFSRPQFEIERVALAPGELRSHDRF